MKKNLKINCATCDARKITEDVLSAYENVKINCASLIVSAESQALLNRFGASLNCAGVTEVPMDVQFSAINGSHSITAADAPTGRTYLLVNGALEIEPGSEKALEAYYGIHINGCLTCPKSLSGRLPNVTINGATTFYPDDAIVLKSTAVIDRLFALRARNKLYWAERRMIMVDPGLDGATLAKKGVTFSTREVIVAEGLVETLLPLIDERAQITIVPDGTSVIWDDVTLNAGIVKRYGTKLYITGDLAVSEDSAEVLETIAYLKVCGDVTVPAELQDILLEKAEIKGNITLRKPFRGRKISDTSSVRISRWMLEHEENGILVEDCAHITLDADIPNELIMDRLQMVDCATAHCTPEQEGALHLVCQDCASISSGSEEEEKPQEDTNTVQINAANYTF